MNEQEKSRKSVSIRIPRDLLEPVKVLAGQHNRSLNGAIVTALRDYVAKQQSTKAPA